MVGGLLTDYIARNYKRLLICMVPPRTDSVSYSSDDNQPSHQHQHNDHHVSHDPDHDDEIPSLDDLHREGFAQSRSTRSSDATPRWRRRRSSPSLPRSRSTREHHTRRQRDIYVHDGEQLVRVDPFRGCVSSRSSGPRTSGDFVVMGCMQV